MSGRPPKRQRLNATVLRRPASNSAASSLLSRDCRRVISCGDWLVCALMSSSCTCHNFYAICHLKAEHLVYLPEAESLPCYHAHRV